METLLVIFIVVMLFIISGGLVQTFKRNWILALICLIAITPLWFFWGFIEMFMDPPKS